MRTLVMVVMLAAAHVPAAAPQLSVADKATAIQLVKGQLKDPDSAEFRGIKKMENGGYCGWVNAKNAFGGYVGYSVFFIGPEPDRQVVVNPPDFGEPDLC